MEDDRVAILEAQLAQAKLIAEEADKKYEEVVAEDSKTCINNAISLVQHYLSLHISSKDVPKV